jgi:membrane fusion protein (multidrug efflux system)
MVLAAVKAGNLHPPVEASPVTRGRRASAPVRRWARAMAALVGIVVVPLAGCRESPRSAPPPALPVQVAPVVEQDVPIQSEWVGTLVGYVDAQIRARVSGHLFSLNYKEGSFVKSGDLLFQVDPRPYLTALEQAAARLRLAESNVAQAQTQVSVSQAQVEEARASRAQAEANVTKAEATQRQSELDVGRYAPAAVRGAVSQQELDTAVQTNLANVAAVAAAGAALQNARASVARAAAALEKARVDVETQQADVAAARAVLAEAQLNLGYTRITSPIDGIAGLRGANIGDLVGPNDSRPLTTVSQVDPIYAEAAISEQLAYSVFRRWADDPAAPRHLELELVLADGSVYPRRGRLDILDRQVDLKTGTVMARGIFPNPGNALRPGQYAKVRAVTEVKKNALLVPQRAVLEVQGARQVAVVGADGTVEIRPVQVGPRTGSLWIIEQGVKPGERVVVEGLDKVRPGAKVKPEPASPNAPSGRGPAS